MLLLTPPHWQDPCAEKKREEREKSSTERGESQQLEVPGKGETFSLWKKKPSLHRSYQGASLAQVLLKEGESSSPPLKAFYNLLARFSSALEGAQAKSKPC